MINAQTRVRHLHGKTGTTCPDFMSCCTSKEVPVVYDGENDFIGTLENELEILGPENAIPDPEGCGVGKGKDCCIFLTAGPEGFECERFSTLRFTLIFREMSAKRHPEQPYPYCMNQATRP